MPISELTYDQKLADLLHSLLCERPHSEICGWWYHNDPLNDLKNSHTKEYMDMVERLRGRSLEEILKFLKDLFGPEVIETKLLRHRLSHTNTL